MQPLALKPLSHPPMFPLKSIPTEVIRKEFQPAQGYITRIPLNISTQDTQNAMAATINPLSHKAHGEFAISLDPFFKLFVKNFGYDLNLLREGDGDCGVEGHRWNVYGQMDRIPVVIRWRAFAGQAIFVLGSDMDTPYFGNQLTLAILADEAMHPHVLKVLNQLEPAPKTETKETTKAIAEHDVMVLVKNQMEMQSMIFSSSIALPDDCGRPPRNMMTVAEDFLFSCGWLNHYRSFPSLDIEKAPCTISWIHPKYWQRVRNNLFRQGIYQPVKMDVSLNFDSKETIPASILETLKRNSISDAEVIMENILRNSFKSHEEVMQDFSERETPLALLDHEERERSLSLNRIIWGHSNRLFTPFKYFKVSFSRDFEKTPGKVLLGTGPLYTKELEHHPRVNDDILLTTICSCAHEADRQIRKKNQGEDTVLTAHFVMNPDEKRATDGYLVTKFYEVKKPYLELCRGLPVLITHTCSCWRPGMSEALACDFYFDQHTSEIFYAGLYRVPAPKEANPSH